MKKILKILIIASVFIIPQSSKAVRFEIFKADWTYYCFTHSRVEYLRGIIDRTLQKLTLAIDYRDTYLTAENVSDYDLTFDGYRHLTEAELAERWIWLNQYKQDHLA